MIRFLSSSRVSRELKLFFAASFIMGIGYSVFDSILNNFLSDQFALSGFQRSFLEFPRETPGFLTVFVSASLWFLCSRRLGAVTMLLCALGCILIGFVSTSYMVMVVWLFIYSLGQHLFLPLSSTIGMDLASEGQVGRRLGQLNAVRNLSALLGTGCVFAGFRFLGLTFQYTFLFAAIAYVLAAVLMFSMTPDKTQMPKMYLKLRREYTLYYVLAVLYGSRKQLFLTFGPWVLVTVFHQPTQWIAFLMMIGGGIGIIFQPILGRAIDRLGERTILMSEALLLIFVCLGYGFSKSLFTEKTAFLIVCVCYLLDQILMSVNMARSTYMKKIAIDPSHLQPALTSSVTIDHIFSISIGLLGGVIWNNFGFQYVFLLGAVIALCNFYAATRMRIPKQK